MSTTFTPPEAGHFRPVSMSDFQTTAKHLSWLSGLPLQRSQEVLAQIYGYSGLHELQRVMAKPGEAGPFSHRWDGHMASQVGHELFYANPVLADDRFYRTLDLLGQATGYDSTTLPPRLDRVNDLLIFDPPSQQREAFRLLRSKLEIMEGKDAGGEDRLATEYAYLDRVHDVPVLRFTELGRSIYDAIQDLLPEDNGQSVSNFSFEECSARVEAIALRHPNNPWPSALFITAFAYRYFQGGWADNLRHNRDKGFDPDVDPGFKRSAKKNALTLLPYARSAISLFEELYGTEKSHAPDHKSYILDVDTFTWPAVLYWGGLVALNAGEDALAKRWLTLHRKIVPDDNFGARFHLTAMALNNGKPKINYIGVLGPLGKTCSRGTACTRWAP